MSEAGPLGKTGWAIVAIFAVPLISALLLAWTLMGYLCSLQGGAVLALVAALLVSAGVVDTRIFLGPYDFNSSLLDPACALLAAYVAHLLLLRRQDSDAVLASERRRLAALPVAVAMAAFLGAKISVVWGNAAQDRWELKLAWLWLALFGSVFVYVSLAGWWTNTSMPRLHRAEAALLEAYGEVEFEQTVVSSLGTVCVKGFHDSVAAGSAGSSPQKPVLVLVHGYAAGNGFWMFILKELSEHFRVACVEMYGCGRSHRLPFTARGPAETEKLLVESLENWREEMGIEEMVLCGHSLGGMMSSAYAMAHPSRIKKLFLLSPAGVGGAQIDDSTTDSFAYKIYSFLWTRGVGFLGVLRWAGPFGGRLAKLIIAKRLSWVPVGAKIKEVDRDLLGEYVYQLLALPASGEKIIFPLLDPMLHAYRPVLETLKGVGGGGGEDEGGSRRAAEPAVRGEEGAGMSGDRMGISCPVSIIYGAPDQDWMPYRHGVALAASLTRQGITARVYSVPDAGHTLIIDNPEEFTRIFLEAYFSSGV